MRSTLTDHEVELLLGALGTERCPGCWVEYQWDLGLPASLQRWLSIAINSPCWRQTVSASSRGRRCAAPDDVLEMIRGAGLVAP